MAEGHYAKSEATASKVSGDFNYLGIVSGPIGGLKNLYGFSNIEFNVLEVKNSSVYRFIDEGELLFKVHRSILLYLYRDSQMPWDEELYKLISKEDVHSSVERISGEFDRLSERDMLLPKPDEKKCDKRKFKISKTKIGKLCQDMSNIVHKEFNTMISKARHYFNVKEWDPNQPFETEFKRFYQEQLASMKYKLSCFRLRLDVLRDMVEEDETPEYEDDKYAIWYMDIRDGKSDNPSQIVIIDDTDKISHLLIVSQKISKLIREVYTFAHTMIVESDLVVDQWKKKCENNPTLLDRIKEDEFHNFKMGHPTYFKI